MFGVLTWAVAFKSTDMGCMSVKMVSTKCLSGNLSNNEVLKWLLHSWEQTQLLSADG